MDVRSVVGMTVFVREAYARSPIALDIFSLEGQVPESKIKGKPADISPIAEYAWYE
jgi:hypothetical protein